MRNPWLDLPHQAPFVLTEDAKAVANFNRSATDATRIHVELLPEPFLGDPKAPVVLLSLNPGFSHEDADCHTDPTFARLSRANLEHRACDHPFYLLNPTVSGPGRRWWDRRLSRLLDLAGRQVVASRVLCVEYFGYHSDVFAHRRLRLPSQEYGFFLVREALARRAIVVLTRGRQLWFNAVPELEKHSRLFTLRSVQNTTISPRNCPTGFAKIAMALQAPILEGSG